jgi:hypothetical protein
LVDYDDAMKSPTPFPLWTSRFQAQEEIIASGVAPVAITRGSPKFPLRYKLVDHVRILAPNAAEFEMTTDEEFRTSYFGRMDAYGVDRIGRSLRRAWHVANDPESGLLLLCFEDVWAGQKCHRRDFADWWELRTGQVVHELPSRSKAAPREVQMKLDEAVGDALGI